MTTVFGRTGDVVALSGDYTASQIINTPSGSISANNVQNALNELDTEKLALAGGTMSGALNMGSNAITNLAAPTNANDAARKADVDTKQTSSSNLTAISSATATSGTYLRGDGTNFVASPIQKADLPQLDATQIGNGLVSNTSYNHLKDVSGNIQIQLDTNFTLANALTTTKQDVNPKLTAISSATATAGTYLRGNGTIFVAANIAAGDLPTGIDAAKIGNQSVSNDEFACLDGVTSSIQTQLNGKVATTSLAAANGVATLDANAKLLSSQIPSSLVGAVKYQGTWDADTNTPTLLANPGAETQGNYYVVSVGAVRFGITWQVGDWAISSGSAWQEVDNQNLVSSVFDRTGAVVAVAGDYNASQITNTPSGSISATNVQNALNGLDTAKLALAGGTMSGTLNMNSNAITNLPAPSNANDAARKADVDTKQDSNSKLTAISSATPTAASYLRGDGTAFVSSAILADDLPFFINATKIASGAVTNTEFEYLDGVTAPIQTQLTTLQNKTQLVTSSATSMTVGGNINTQSLAYNTNTPTAGSVLDLGSATSSMIVPKGTTAQQPATGAAGMIRYNTTTSSFEGYTNAWGPFGGGTFSPSITSPAAGDLITYDSVNGVWTNTLVPVKSPPTVSVSTVSVVTVTAPVLLLANVNVSNYKIQVSTNNTFTALVYDSPYQASNTFDITVYVTGGTTYYVRGLIQTDLNNKLTQWSTTTTWTAPTNGTGAYGFATRMSGTSSEGSQFAPLTSISRDASNNMIYIGSYVSNPMTIYNANGSSFGTLANAVGSTCGFVVKYNSSGTGQWASRMVAGTASGNCNLRSVVTDSSSNVFVAGTYSDSGSGVLTIYNADGSAFGTTINPGSSTTLFMVKYNSAGVVQWVTRIVSSNVVVYWAFNLAIDTAGNPYLFTDYNSTITIYNASGSTFQTYTASGGSYDCFIVKYNTSGVGQWSVNLGTASSEYPAQPIIFDSGNSVFISFAYYANISILNANGTTFSTLTYLDPNAGGANTALVKYNSIGAVQWAVRISGSTAFPSFAAVDGADNVVLCAYYRSSTAQVYNANGTSFGTLPTTPSSAVDWGVVVKYNSAGAVQWYANTSGSSQPDRLAIDPSNNIVLSGRQYATIMTVNNSNGSSFGTITKVTSNSVIPYVVKYDSSGAVQWATKLDGPASSATAALLRDILIDSNSNIYLGASFSSGSLVVSNANGSTFSTLSNDGANGVVVAYDPSGIAQWANKVGSANAIQFFDMAFYSNFTISVLMQYNTSSATVYNSNNTVYTTLANAGSGDLAILKIN